MCPCQVLLGWGYYWGDYGCLDCIFRFLVIWDVQSGMGCRFLIWGLGRSLSLYGFFYLGDQIFMFGGFMRGRASYNFLVPGL